MIGSYLVLRLRARFHDNTWVQHALRTTHLRNARRIERTICGLQGLFIKVGQLISIMTNFLPEEFRRELEGLQDAVPPRPYCDIEARIVEAVRAKGDAALLAYAKKFDRLDGPLEISAAEIDAGAQAVSKDVRAAIRIETPYNAGTGLVAIENSHNMAGGTVMSVDAVEQMSIAAEAKSIIESFRQYELVRHIGIRVQNFLSFCLARRSCIESVEGRSRTIGEQGRLGIAPAEPGQQHSVVRNFRGTQHRHAIRRIRAQHGADEAFGDLQIAFSLLHLTEIQSDWNPLHSRHPHVSIP